MAIVASVEGLISEPGCIEPIIRSCLGLGYDARHICLSSSNVRGNAGHYHGLRTGGKVKLTGGKAGERLGRIGEENHKIVSNQIKA